jgi:hypothetical protein
VADLLPSARRRTLKPLAGATGVALETGDYSLVSICVAGARDLPSEEFEQRTADAYLAIQETLAAGAAPNPVRVWNHLPDIHAPGSGGIDRYMAFNAGRFHAYSQWLGGAGAFDRTIPSASAVGHDGPDMVIHALGCREPGIAVANPRQIAPYRYSKRFGPLPPCFARATVLAADASQVRKILVGGTASIRGEESIYLDDITRQTSETFHNLAHLMRAAIAPTANGKSEMTDSEARRWLVHFRNLRVYYLREMDRAFIELRVAGEFSRDCRVEYVRADLCRAELLVEIEGLAEAPVLHLPPHSV